MSQTTAIASETRLRDLTDEQFEGRYDTDRFTATVLSNRLRYSVQHVATGLLHRAFSPIIALSYDFAVAVCGPPEQGYQMTAVTNALTVFLGTMADGVRVAVEEFGIDRLKDGDLLICNDPSRMGNHPNDLCFIRPVFRDGKIVSFVVLRAHQIDIGGTVPGGFSGSKRNTYENGLVISPRLMYDGGKPVRETFSLIFDNVRFGQMLLPDFATIQGCCVLGEQLLQESIDRYGEQAYLGTLRYSCDATAESMQTAFEALPDGDYQGSGSLDADGIDANEEYVVNLTVRKRGSRVEADFSGTSRQARTSLNGGALDAKTAVGVGLKMLLDPHSAFTSGSFRDIDIVIPPGTVTSALPPDGAIFMYWEVASVIMGCLLQALAEPLGDAALGGDTGSNNLHNAYGVRPDGTPWACSAMAGGETGPWGANSVADGDGHTCSYLLNIMSPSSESLEADFPVRIMRKEYDADSAGPGFNRGGAAILKDIMWTEPAEHQTLPVRFRHGSGNGVVGAGDGLIGGAWIFRQDGGPTEGEDAFVTIDDEKVYAEATPVAGMMDPETHVLDPAGEYAYYCSTPVWPTDTGATWRYMTNGGGGWGNPLERDPERVKNDVRDGYVSIEGAARDYGVVITGDPESDPENLVIDVAATEAKRAGR